MENYVKVPWEGWSIVREIGRGSFGSVYEIQREVRGFMETAAMKMLTIPQNKSEINALRADGYDDDSITEYFKDSIENIEGEYALMAALKGHPNIVHCEDIVRVKHDDGFGWDIFIRMELLTPIKPFFSGSVDENEIIRLGVDLARALEGCKLNNIIHRDIKPENIFVSSFKVYKLGDFGISKVTEGTAGGTRTGTYGFMAPEVYNNNPYGIGVDIYSLGLVMYWLLNEKNEPFCTPGGKRPTPSELNIARSKRMNGDQIPPPAHGSFELKMIIRKATAFEPSERYSNPTELREDLEAVLHGGKPRYALAAIGMPARPASFSQGEIPAKPQASVQIPMRPDSVERSAYPAGSMYPGGTAQSGSSMYPAGSMYPGGTAQSGSSMYPAGSMYPSGTAQSGSSMYPAGSMYPSGTAQSGSSLYPAGSMYPSGTAQSGSSVYPAAAMVPGGTAQPAAQPVNKSFGTDYKVGDTFEMGTYANKPIEWQVCYRDDASGEVLVITSKCIEGMAMKASGRASWEQSEVRAWLNTSFYNTSFLAPEKERIVAHKLDNPGNPVYGVGAGAPTADNVFLLSCKEAMELFEKDKHRKTVATRQARKNTRVKDAAWWLRTSGKDLDAFAVVFGDGRIFTDGYAAVSPFVAVRPAMWIKL